MQQANIVSNPTTLCLLLKSFIVDVCLLKEEKEYGLMGFDEHKGDWVGYKQASIIEDIVFRACRSALLHLKARTTHAQFRLFTV